jgi:hypothetical protein
MYEFSKGRNVHCLIVSGGLLVSGRRPDWDSEVPDLWSNGSAFMGLSAPISINPSPHIQIQQTTARKSDTGEINQVLYKVLEPSS